MKKQLLIAGLLTGAVALGSGCKMGTSNMPAPGSEQSVPAPVDNSGMGGSGQDTPQSAPIPDDGIREREPDVHNTPIDEPGTGGSGMIPDHGVERPDVIGNDTVEDPLNKAPPVDSSMDDSMTEDSAVPQR